MHVKKTINSETEVVLLITADAEDLAPIKGEVLRHLRSQVKLQGFRSGKAPLELVEKNVDPAQLQSQFIDEALNHLYPLAATQEKIRPVDQPGVSLKKFVPFTTLEFEATVPVLGIVKIADYTKFKKPMAEIIVSEKDVTEVINSLMTRGAEKKDVDRVAQEGDQLWIDFKGVDEKGEPVNGAEGKDYPIIVGSKTFIPGFEENLVALKAGDDKTFTIRFPKDYGVKALADREVTFTVDVTKVQEVILPKLDDAFAAQAGPFKNLKELKEDIIKQLKKEREYQSTREYESELVRDIAAKSTVQIPKVLIDEQAERLMQDLKQNLVYKGLTLAEFLESEGKNEADYLKDIVVPQAEERVKAGIVLAEIADKEAVTVSNEEVSSRLEQLKRQYKDPAMQAELEKSEKKRDIASQIVTEKTVAKLVAFAKN